MEIVKWISYLIIGLPIVFIFIMLTDTTNYKVTKGGMAYGPPKIPKVSKKTYKVCAVIVSIGLILRLLLKLLFEI